jgi:dienelactone hydrolase
MKRGNLQTKKNRITFKTYGNLNLGRVARNGEWPRTREMVLSKLSLGLSHAAGSRFSQLRGDATIATALLPVGSECRHSKGWGGKMNRRAFIADSSRAALAFGLSSGFRKSTAHADGRSGEGAWQATSEPVLPGTSPLTMQGDLAAQMVDGIHQFLLRGIQSAAQERARLWQRDYHSAEAYSRSVEANRERFRQIIGAVDPRAGVRAPELLATTVASAEVSRASGYKVYTVSWPVFDRVVADFDGLAAEGLLLQPEGKPVARVVAVPDADWTPEMLVGLAPGVAPEAQFARRLAENGCQVIIPVIINRDDAFSGIPGIAFTNETHREWIYRMAYEVGRHIIGYEVQEVLAAVDWFAQESNAQSAPIGVMGYAEGGLLAFYAGALDPRINVTVVSGYFEPREEAWKQPIYRDVWGLVREFGDAEVASLIVPRALVIEACRAPQVGPPPPATAEHTAMACPNGTLVTSPLEEVRREVERARPFFAGLKAEGKLRLVVSQLGTGQPGSEEALEALLGYLDVRTPLRPSGKTPHDARTNYDPEPRLHCQFDRLVGFTQALIRKSPDRRAEFWAKADASSLERWKATTKYYRDYLWDEVIGRLPSPSLPANPRTRLIYDAPKFKGYEVVLDVWPNVFAYGILLVPKDIKPGERRPVVVCQHGLESRPQDVADPKDDSPAYHHYAASLADEGFVTYSPQNPYIGEDSFRIIQRMGHPVKLALYSFIIGQHEQTLNWLAAQTFVDSERIGFYGLSYGGKTAMRVPPFLDRYVLSICSGDFNEWVWKTTNVSTSYSYLLTREYDMYEFNFANVVNYADLANLMAPRPFMVERGHNDFVGMDEWISFEYAKVRRFYDKMGIPNSTSIEFFNGPHEIHGVGTFEFLRKHLISPR